MTPSTVGETTLFNKTSPLQNVVGFKVISDEQDFTLQKWKTLVRSNKFCC